MDDLIPTCANTYAQRGHVWHDLIGGRRCDVCGKQELIHDFTPMEFRLTVWRYAITKPRAYVVGISAVGA